METLYNIKKWALIGACFVTQAFLLGEPEFNLPEGTPGLQPGFRTPSEVAAGEFVCVRIPNAGCDLYFPSDGSQPTTQDAGAWSGARGVAPADNDAVTDWWVRVFGGDRAVELSKRCAAPERDNATQMGFKANGEPTHIIRVNTGIAGTPAGFEQQFWQTFRTIAADPVGRVLLYRLLIEIRRVDPDNRNQGCCGADVLLPMLFDIKVRNNVRSITIYSDKKCAFCQKNSSIKFMYDNAKTTRTLSVVSKGLTTQLTQRTTDIGLFHEMLHWFHLLRNPIKKGDNKNYDNQGFSYATRCYYGVPTTATKRFRDAFTWRKKATEPDSRIINGEEIATILGSPDLRTDPHAYVFYGRDLIHPNAFCTSLDAKDDTRNYDTITINGGRQYIPKEYNFLNGEDLSENVYRASRGYSMRWGHVSTKPIRSVSLLKPPNRFRLAHKIASNCYQAITGNPPPNWLFVQGQAIR